MAASRLCAWLKARRKVDTLPETGITKICLSAFNSDDIENSRAITYANLAPTKKFLRRKEGSEQKSLQEIIKIIKEADPEILPTFVAHNLNKLPPVSFDYIDITTFLKELTILKNDVAYIKSKPDIDNKNVDVSSDINLLKSEIKELKTLIRGLREAHAASDGKHMDHLSLRPYHSDKDTRNTLNNVQTTTNFVTGASESRFDAIEGGSDINAAIVSERHGGPLDTCVITSARALTRTGSARARRPLVPAPALSTHQLTAGTETKSTHVLSYRDIASAPPIEAHVNNDDDGFTLVSRKKTMPYKYKNTRGTLQSSKLLAADAYAYVYISRTHKSTTVEDIKEHIQDLKEECIDVEKLTQTRETNFSSFKVKILSTKLNSFLRNDFWPQGFVFRRYRQSRSIRNDTAASNFTNG
ncbi:uncharacterized protein LOC111357915 [Spodoptera litura]|uniref:Uncharacterized protein LOC111357915 n=1 Tax=Spodoptera litura TaxID=69820 RepID=A0A9J7IXD3_SPOLT|nr:uncharacterized protein LOC111357915 [Spodoptera litura]